MNQKTKFITLTIAAVIALGAFTACAPVMSMLHPGVKKPAQSEFGLGPRTSSKGYYVAVLHPSSELRPRRLQTIEVSVRDTAGNPVDGAQITIDGGMPQHGHGLPTQPRVTRNDGDGSYVIEGVRFNMGGWWEFKLAINGRAGADTVTFNLAL